MPRNPQLGHAAPHFDHWKSRPDLFTYPLESMVPTTSGVVQEPLKWPDVQQRVAIVPEILPLDLTEYVEILKNLTPASKGELTMAKAGLVHRVLSSRSPSELYRLLGSVERYTGEATKSLQMLPELRAFRWNYDIIGETIRHSTEAQETLADYQMAVDWLSAGKWQPKSINGVPTKSITESKKLHISELMTYSNEALGRLTGLVRGKQEYRQAFWQNQQDQLKSLLEADISSETSRGSYKARIVQGKMKQLQLEIENYIPADEELA